MSAERVLVIGAGPSGCSVLIQFKKLAEKGAVLPEIVCYEKAKVVGGLWNVTWRVGLDEYGQPVHGSMYRHLWSNGPKEALELGDYTFDDHFGKPIPSFPPRAVLADYLKGWFNKHDIEKDVTFQHRVDSVTFDEETSKFSVLVTNLSSGEVVSEKFDYVVVCGGHFSSPRVPEFPGIQDFPGRVIHAHDFRDARQFKGQRLLVVGGSYSAEDIGMQARKFGASQVTISCRSGLAELAFKWPDGVEEKPILTEINGYTVTFKDGSRADYDAIILCTGYYINNSFMEKGLRLTGFNPLYNDHCYKGLVWMPSAKGRLFYIAYHDQYYTYTMFDVEASYTVKVITGQIPLPPNDVMQEDCKKWKTRCDNLKSCYDEIEFQTDYVNDLKQLTGYPYPLDAAQIFHTWEDTKKTDVTTYRDQAYTSIHTGTTSTIHHTPWMEAMSDSIEDFISDERRMTSK